MKKTLQRLRVRAGGAFIKGVTSALAGLGRLHPGANPARHGVEVLRDIPYRAGGAEAHTLDVYRPLRRDGRRPVVLYVHGGGFRILSKDTHWMMGLAFARRGYVVFNVNYRLAPRHKFPAALEDVCDAYAWVVENAARFGGDARRLVLAGESAGANLVTSLAVCAAYRRPEPYAATVFATGVSPVAVIPACGILQVTDTGRFERLIHKGMSPWVADRIHETSHGYIGGVTGNLDLADPLVVLERGKPPDRPLPPFYTFVGTRDPLLDDTRRLHAALTRLGVRSEVRYIPGEPHAFHALVWRPTAIATWRDKLQFLDEIIAPLPAPAE
jgi:acetyl esterase